MQRQQAVHGLAVPNSPLQDLRTPWTQRESSLQQDQDQCTTDCSTVVTQSCTSAASQYQCVWAGLD